MSASYEAEQGEHSKQINVPRDDLQKGSGGSMPPTASPGLSASTRGRA